MMKISSLSPLLSALFFALFLAACTNDPAEEPTPPPMPDPEATPPETLPTIWTGEIVSFEKESGADPTLEENQDRITDQVWITRGNDGGQMFNAVTESASIKASSPAGTLWAKGTTDNLADLTFEPFRAAVGNPQQVVGEDLVLLLEEENIAIDLKITSWAQNQQGGFAYERSSK
ncbi:MAG: hypothetical protein AAF399_02830 [Bacteroidota bacterium]